MAYLWFALACFFAWRVWLYRKTLEEATEVINDLEASQHKLTEDAQLKQEEYDRLNDQVQALRRELQQHEVRYKEAQQTIGTLARQWESLQIKHEQTTNQLTTTRAETEHYKNAAIQAQHDAQARIEHYKLELEDRWQEADEKLRNAEQEAIHIVMAAQEEAQQIDAELENAKKEKRLLLQTLDQLAQEIEALTTDLPTATAAEIPGGMMMKAVTRQLSKQRPKSAPNTRRPPPPESPKEEHLAAHPVAEVSQPMLPAAGVAVRSDAIVRLPQSNTPYKNKVPFPKDEDDDRRMRRLSRRAHSSVNQKTIPDDQQHKQAEAEFLMARK